jgi:hypothetical protein
MSLISLEDPLFSVHWPRSSSTPKHPHQLGRSARSTRSLTLSSNERAASLHFRIEVDRASAARRAVKNFLGLVPPRSLPSSRAGARQPALRAGSQRHVVASERIHHLPAEQPQAVRAAQTVRSARSCRSCRPHHPHHPRRPRRPRRSAPRHTHIPANRRSLARS